MTTTNSLVKNPNLDLSPILDLHNNWILTSDKKLVFVHESNFDVSLNPATGVLTLELSFNCCSDLNQKLTFNNVNETINLEKLNIIKLDYNQDLLDIIEGINLYSIRSKKQICYSANNNARSATTMVLNGDFLALNSNIEENFKLLHLKSGRFVNPQWQKSQDINISWSMDLITQLTYIQIPSELELIGATVVKPLILE